MTGTGGFMGKGPATVSRITLAPGGPDCAAQPLTVKAADTTHIPIPARIDDATISQRQRRKFSVIPELQDHRVQRNPASICKQRTAGFIRGVALTSIRQVSTAARKRCFISRYFPR
jgi:hypothetical protein